MSAEIPFDFEAPPPIAEPLPARSVTRIDERRLNSQSHTILTMLRARPQTNVDLSAVALKYTSRISDLRQAGYRIACERVGAGLTRYILEPESRA